MRVFGCMCVCVSVCLCGGTRWEAEREHARARRARQVVRSHVRGSLLEVGEVGESKVVGSDIVADSGRNQRQAEGRRVCLLPSSRQKVKVGVQAGAGHY